MLQPHSPSSPIEYLKRIRAATEESPATMLIGKIGKHFVVGVDLHHLNHPMLEKLPFKVGTPRPDGFPIGASLREKKKGKVFLGEDKTFYVKEANAPSAIFNKAFARYCKMLKHPVKMRLKAFNEEDDRRLAAEILPGSADAELLAEPHDPEFEGDDGSPDEPALRPETAVAAAGKVVDALMKGRESVITDAMKQQLQRMLDQFLNDQAILDAKDDGEADLDRRARNRAARLALMSGLARKVDGPDIMTGTGQLMGGTIDLMERWNGDPLSLEIAADIMFDMFKRSASSQLPEHDVEAAKDDHIKKILRSKRWPAPGSDDHLKHIVDVVQLLGPKGMTPERLVGVLSLDGAKWDPDLRSKEGLTFRQAALPIEAANSSLRARVGQLMALGNSLHQAHVAPEDPRAPDWTQLLDDVNLACCDDLPETLKRIPGSKGKHRQSLIDEARRQYESWKGGLGSVAFLGRIPSDPDRDETEDYAAAHRVARKRVRALLRNQETQDA